MSLLEVKSIAPQMLGAVLELDDLCFGGLWTLEAYQRELDSPNSVLLGLFVGDSTEQGGRGTTHYSLLTPHSSPPHSSLLLSIGCFWEILDEAHITLLAVHPNYQGRGLGQAMLLALMIEAIERGLERATLEVRASNLPALSLYQKFGFKFAGRRRKYYKDTNEDALILWRGDLQSAEFKSDLASSYQFVSDRLHLSGWNFKIILNT